MKFQVTSLYDHLLQGPDQLNILMEGLCQFYLELIAIICNIEWMYSRFSVSKNRDYLCFLWWPGEDLNEEPKEYWTKVHILGAVSSPSYTIFV